MGGFFGVAAKDDCVFDLFFGIDYHSHLGTRRGGMTVYGDKGFDRSIHNIENAPFRTKFDKDMQNMKGYFGIGCISDYEPQPLIVRSHHGTYALTTVSKINNVDEISKEIFDQGHSHFLEMSGGDINSTELVAALINQKDNLIDGIRYALEKIDGSLSLLLMNQNGIYAARDMHGRTPVVIGKKDGAFCASFENFAYKNLGYHDYKELGPGEVVVLTPSNCVTLVQPACGQVDLSYFSDAAFLGDSLTVGFSDYQINLSGALICGYTGVGPDAIVNRAAVKSPIRGQEVALDVLAAAQPKKLYILLGTNTLTTLGASDRFLAYYGQMLDELRQTLGEDCIIYVQSIPPVRPAAAEKKPGLASDVLRGVNEQLAQLAASKGCVYLDLWEALADGEGNLKEMIAAPDGVHLSAGNGYGAWVTYLRNHAKYSANNPWIMGSAYSAE